jgi:hypothetical protein
MRVQRLILHLIAAACVAMSLLLLLLLARWVRSFFIVDMVSFAAPDPYGQVWANHGQLLIQAVSSADAGWRWNYHVSYMTDKARPNNHLSWWRRHGVNWRPGPMDSPEIGVRDRVLSMPILLLVLLFAVPAYVLWVVRRRMIRVVRLQEGRCLICNYDLRATPDQCPECGHKRSPAPTGHATA